MRFELPAHISFGFIGTAAVVLDARADRYLLLGADEAATLSDLAGGSGDGFDPERAGRLAGRGLIAPGSGRRIMPVDAAIPTRSALETPGPAASIGVWEIARKRLAATLSLRFAGLAPTIARWRGARTYIERHGALSDGSSIARNEEAAAAYARGFAESRLFLPAPRRCVPDSLALVDGLWRRGQPADLYFGVRLAPFAAHCWVQAGDYLLSDPFDIVREFTPVFRL